MAVTQESQSSYLLTPDEAAAFVGCTREDLDASGLPVVLFGKAMRYKRSLLVRLKMGERFAAAPPLPRDRSAYQSTRSFVYVVERIDTSEIKIGVTVNWAARFSSLQTGQAGPLKLLACVGASELYETVAHAFWRSHRIRGEWFRASSEMRTWARRLAKSCRPDLRTHRRTIARSRR